MIASASIQLNIGEMASQYVTSAIPIFTLFFLRPENIFESE